MPKLEMFELWNNVEGEGLIFRCIFDQNAKPDVQFWTSSEQ